MEKVSAVIASPHYLASEIGTEVLLNGGNAFDAAVAVSLAIGVTQPYHSGIGGGCNISFYSGGKAYHINARGPAPKNISPANFQDSKGATNYEKVKAGGLAVTIPSLIAGLRTLHKGRGKLSWSDVCEAPLNLAKQGFRADFMLANVYANAEIASKIGRFGKDSPFATPLKEGELVLQPEMAETLALIGKDPSVVYKGEIAKQLVSSVQRHEGVLELGDLASYEPEYTELYDFSYRDWQIFSPGLPTIGALQTQLALKILDQFSLSHMGPGSSQYLNLIATIVKATFLKRAELEVSEISSELSSLELAKHLAKALALNTKQTIQETPAKSDACTSHFCVADDEGNIVSQTQTIRNHFGSGIVDVASGIVLNDSIGDFSLKAGETTTQGIHYRGTFNLLAGGLEPASSQCPLIAMHPESGDLIAVGAAGGPKIVSATLQALVNQIDFDLSAQVAVSLPRVHNHGNLTYLESSGKTATELKALGHELGDFSSNGISQTIRKRNASWEAGSDPRGPGGTSLVLRSKEKVIRKHGYSY